jgi:hypothetical protein
MPGTAIAFGSHLRDFLGGLRPHRFCIPCLAKMCAQPEPPIRQAMQALVGRLESQVAECRNCAETSQTYRLHDGAA